MKADDLLRHRLKFGLLGGKHAVRPLLADHWPIRGHADHPKLVNAAQLPPVLPRSPGHAGQFLVQLEIALKGNLGSVIGRHGNRHPFLGFDGLMQPLAPMAVGHAPPRKFIDDHHFLFMDHVMLIEAEPEMGVQAAFNVLVQLVHGMRVWAHRGIRIADNLPSLFG